MWIVKTKMITVITGTTGTISKSFRKYLSKITGTTENSHIGHCTHTSKVLMQKCERLNVGNNIMCTINF